MGVKWTEKQKDIIDFRGGNLLVSAAAGSGKTAVLVERIISLITDSEHPVDIDRLLVVTFTRAAAGEMKERIAKSLSEMLSNDPENENLKKQISLVHGADICTIDSFCGKLVKENFQTVDIDPGYRIADEIETGLMKSDVIADLLAEKFENEEEDFVTFAKGFSKGKIGEEISGMVLTLFNKAEAQTSPSEWLEKLKEPYVTESFDKFCELGFIADITDYSNGILDEAVCILETAENICTSPYGPEKYIDAITELKTDVVRARNAEDFAGRKAVIEEIVSGSYKFGSVRDVNPVKKAFVANKRKEVVNEIKSLYDSFYAFSLEEFYEKIKRTAPYVIRLIDLTKEFSQRFEGEKKDKGILDFSDQEHLALDILCEKDGEKYVPSKLAKEIAKGYHEIMIDEFQDSNYIQFGILSAISKGEGKNNLFMVGDVKQSIYRFRNARPEIFLDLYNKFSIDKSAQSVKMVLDRNFRSRSEVLESVNYLFDYLMEKNVSGIDYTDNNRLVLGADFPDLPKGQDNSTELAVLFDESNISEATYVANKIKEITDPETGMMVSDKDGLRRARYNDVVILLRSTKTKGSEYLSALAKLDIPAYAETKDGFYESTEIQDILALMSVVDNPHSDIPVASSMTSLMFGFTPQELAIIKAESRKKHFFDSVTYYGEYGRDEALRLKVENYLKVVEDLSVKATYMEVDVFIDEILKVTGYEYISTAMPDGSRRLMNISILKEKAMSYSETSYKGLFNFVRYIEQIKDMKYDEGSASVNSEHDNLVRIMTIHKSKGLQFPIVFVCGLGTQTPADKSKFLIDDDDLFGCDLSDSERKTTFANLTKRFAKVSNKKSDMAEKLRILYVALTRAEEKLFLVGKSGGRSDKRREAVASERMQALDTMTMTGFNNNQTFLKLIEAAYCRNKAYDSIIPDSDYYDESEAYSTDIPFKVSYIDIPIKDEENTNQKSINVYDTATEFFDVSDDEYVSKVREKIEYEYPYPDDVWINSKYSVSDIKKMGEVISESDFIAEDNPVVDEEIVVFSGKVKATERGTTYHKLFELLDFSKENLSISDIEDEIEMLVDKKLISKDASESVFKKDFVTFSNTDLAKRMREAFERGMLYRERAFIVSAPVTMVYPDVESKEDVIIQGVIDACFIENDEYVIVDYKTDRVEREEELIDRYKVQLEVYSYACEKISGKKVKSMLIYSTCLGKVIEIEERD